MVEAFRNYCKPLKNETYDRYKFFTRTQQDGEDFDHFITDIKTLADVCNFGALQESLIRDKIVSGITDLSLQERLLQQPQLTLVRAEEICLAAEASKMQAKNLRSDKEVDMVKAGPSQDKEVYKCFKCGRTHTRRNCPAFGKVSTNCNKLNHFAIGCKASNVNSNFVNNKNRGNFNNVQKARDNRVKNRNVFEVESDEENLTFIDSINSTDTIINKRWLTEVKINYKIID